jgi:Uma2 family endonuclease
MLDVHNGKRLLTVADVSALPRRLPSGDVDYELRDGRLVVTDWHTDAHGRAHAHVLARVFIHGEETGAGRAYGRVGIVLRRNPDTLLAPDAAFVPNEQLPTRTSPEDFLLTIPALVVEILNRSDTQPEIAEKVNAYLAAGVVVVWVADPDARTVTAYRTGRQPLVFGATDTLTADGVIPGFAVPVADLLPA